MHSTKRQAMGLIAVLILAGMGWMLQRRETTALRRENSRLATELLEAKQAVKTPLPPLPPAPPGLDATEVEALRRDQRELARLRAEVTALREEARQASAGQKEASARATGARAAGQAPDAPALPFAGLTRTSVAGTYRWSETVTGGETKVKTMVLNTNGTFDFEGSARGMTSHRWHLDPRGLIIGWDSGMTVFGDVGAPGVYLHESENKSVRLERVP